MNIAVFCSSSNHIANHYKQSAFQLGELIAENGNTLIYGGATGGSMDSVAEGARSKSGPVIGIIPLAVIKMKRISTLPTQLITVETMSDRKAQMKTLADVFVILPGSYGTLDEMFDIIASGTVGEHKKPTIIINQNGFYNHFLNQIDFMRTESFIPVEDKYKPIIVKDINHCMESINLLK